MLTQSESPARAPAMANGASSKMLQLLRRRLRQLLKVTLVLAIGVALTASALAIWWLTCLNGLPDIGDPFDVDAIHGFSIPDDENALVFLRRAQEKLILLPELPRSVTANASTIAWSQADPRLRAWVEANRPSLELFQQGADRADGIWHPSGWLYWQNYPMQIYGSVMWIALLEGGKRSESGDMAGAWDCYRAVLRMTTHIRRRGELNWRFDANGVHAALRQRLATWAADPRTTIPQLRRALDESIMSRPKPEWDAFSLELEYLELNRRLEQNGIVDNVPSAELVDRLAGFEVPNNLAECLYAGQRFLKREPERSQRALRLVFANWLAHIEIPELRPRRPAVRATLSFARSASSILLYPVSPVAPAGARSISPHELASWLVSTKDLKRLEGNLVWPYIFTQEYTGYRDLVVALAQELYHRERGVLPPSEEALVGTYLEELPDDGSADDDDGTTPTVVDPRISARTPSN
jgi:hypothetical protein